MSDSKNNPNEPKNMIMKDEEALLLDHDYDGIQELDHPLPSWWLGIFYVTIAFSIVYMGYYMTGVGPTLTDELNVALKEIEAMKPASSGADDDENVILAALGDPEKAKKGLGVYVGKCAACHGDKGQGLIGPNLTDNHWIHGEATAKNILRMIRDGVPEKGMPPWGPVLSNDEILEVTAYIKTIYGSNPPGAKEPQGAPQEWKL